MKLKEKCVNIASRIRSTTVPEALQKLFLSWLLVSIFFLAKGGTSFTDRDFFLGINIPVFLSATVILFAVLLIFKDKRITAWLMLSETLVYSVLAIVGFSNFGFAVGLCVVSGIVIYYTDTDLIKLKLHRFVPWIFMGIMAALLTAFIGTLTCLYYKNHWTPNYDFGLFSQMFEYMKDTGLPLTTCERDRLLNHFAVHFSPIYYLILPVYLVFPNPCTLQIVQVFIVASGAMPLLLLCKHKGLSNTSCCAFSLIYALYPCFGGGCLYYLHENNFLPPLLLWFLYFYERGKTVPKILFMVLILMIKEDAALYVIVSALYYILSQKKLLSNLAYLVIPVVYFIVVTSILANYGDGVMTSRYDNYIYDQSGSLLTAVIAVIKNPVYVISQAFTEQKLIFILKMLIPICFLPVLTRKPARYILLIPFLLVNLMTNYKYQYDITYHYCFGSGSILIFLSVINYADLKKPKLLIYSFFCSLIVFTGLYNPRNKYFDYYEKQAVERETIDRALQLVPKDESVAASTFLTANLYDHKELYQLETTRHETKYYVVDMRYTTEEVNINTYLHDDYETVFFEKDIIGVFMLKDDP